MIYAIKYLSDLSLCIAVIEMTSLLLGYSKIRNKCVIFTSAVLCSAIPMVFLMPNTGMSPIVRVMVLLLMMVVEALCYAAVFGRMEIKMLYISVLSFVIDENCTTILKLFSHNKIKIMIASSFAQAVVLFIAMLFIKLRKQEHYARNCVAMVSRRMYLLLLIFLYIMSFYEYVSIMNETISRIMTFPVIIMILYIVAKLIKISVSAHEYEHISNLLSVQLENQTEYYCKITDIYNEFRCFRHDFDNHLICLRKLLAEGSDEQVIKYLDGMNDMCRPIKENYDTGNIIADALLNDKSSKARSAGADIVFKGFVPTMGINNVDLCTIMSNAIDNAVEACAKGTAELHKEITVDSDFSQGYYFLSISNPVFEKVKIEKGNKIRTSKEDKKLHGWGIANIIKTVNKYDGTSDFTVEDGIFTFHAVLKLEQNEI